jgi:predicted nucleotidyltransferase
VSMERTLAVLVDRLVKIYGERLVSVTLYGSAASEDFHRRYSDINVLCVLERLTADELEIVEPIVRWWRDLGNPAPLFMSENEVAASADSFAIEFSDMRERRKVLHGRDVVGALTVDPQHYRIQVEHEVRAGLVRLREHAAVMMSDRDQLIGLCLQSVSTFYLLGRHALLLGGVRVGTEKREIVQQLTAVLGESMASFALLLDVREEKKAPQELDPDTLFRKYLAAVETLVEYVDGLGTGGNE